MVKRNRFAGCQLPASIGACLLLFAGWHAAAQTTNTKPGEPTDPKARKTYAEAVDWQRRGETALAIDTFRKANKQDGGHCEQCQNSAYSLAMEINDFKSAIAVVQEALAQSVGDADRAGLELWLGMALQREGIAEKKQKCFEESCDAFKTALKLAPNLTGVHFGYGTSLAYLHQDDQARAEFDAFLAQDRQNPDLHTRAQRFTDRIELARARMAPAFTATTIDGKRVSLDELAGKVVLIDFWATWCAPCREALPHMRSIAHKFEGQPFVMLSISLDSDGEKWKNFVAGNEMTWLQVRDGGFEGALSRRFNVNAIPATFSIDADGVLEDQHVGDAGIESKLKKMIASAAEIENQKQQAQKAPGSGD
jgi:thiol-disulfide isomerase/thioredoxin